MLLSQFSRKKKYRKLFGKQNKTNEIKLDITGSAAALSIDEKPMPFFSCDPYRCKLASNHHNSHVFFWNEKESETKQKKQQQQRQKQQ